MTRTRTHREMRYDLPIRRDHVSLWHDIVADRWVRLEGSVEGIRSPALVQPQHMRLPPALLRPSLVSSRYVTRNRLDAEAFGLRATTGRGYVTARTAHIVVACGRPSASHDDTLRTGHLASAFTNRCPATIDPAALQQFQDVHPYRWSYGGTDGIVSPTA